MNKILTVILSTLALQLSSKVTEEENIFIISDVLYTQGLVAPKSREIQKMVKRSGLTCQLTIRTRKLLIPTITASAI